MFYSYYRKSFSPDTWSWKRWHLCHKWNACHLFPAMYLPNTRLIAAIKAYITSHSPSHIIIEKKKEREHAGHLGRNFISSFRCFSRLSSSHARVSSQFACIYLAKLQRHLNTASVAMLPTPGPLPVRPAQRGLCWNIKRCPPAPPSRSEPSPAPRRRQREEESMRFLNGSYAS